MHRNIARNVCNSRFIKRPLCIIIIVGLGRNRERVRRNIKRTRGNGVEEDMARRSRNNCGKVDVLRLKQDEDERQDTPRNTIDAWTTL